MWEGDCSSACSVLSSVAVTLGSIPEQSQENSLKLSNAYPNEMKICMTSLWVGVGVSL